LFIIYVKNPCVLKGRERLSKPFSFEPLRFQVIERKPYWLFDLVSPYHHNHLFLLGDSLIVACDVVTSRIVTRLLNRQNKISPLTAVWVGY
jgi:hypothetical protein